MNPGNGWVQRVGLSKKEHYIFFVGTDVGLKIANCSVSEGTRTLNHLFRREVLYPLSYADLCVVL
jgi:hypothetical protein